MNYVVVDMGRVLEESETGRKAAEILKSVYEKAEMKAEKAKKQAKGLPEMMQKPLLKEANEALQEGSNAVEAGRENLREQLIERAKKIVEALAKKKEAELVLARPIALVFDPKKDITDEVIVAVDAKGPLKMV